MKIQRTLAILWLAAFIVMMSYWLWQFLNYSAPAYDAIHARYSLVCLFGIVTCIFLFRGAKWARISMGIIALYFGVGVLFGEILPQGWMRVDKLADDATFLLSLVTVVLLFFPRREVVEAERRRKQSEGQDNRAKAQTAIIVGASVLLLVGTATVTFKKIETSRTGPDSWRTLNINPAILDQSPPQVRILPTKFSSEGSRGTLEDNNADTKWAGLNVTVYTMMWVAYKWPPGRVVFAGTATPRGRYDFITSLSQGSYEALQGELKDRLGLVGRQETRDVKVLVLKVKTPDAAGLKPPNVGRHRNGSINGEYICDDHALDQGLQNFLEGRFHMPVLDETGLTNHYSIDLKCNVPAGGNQYLQSLKQALLDQLGLELVPDQRPIEMLVVEKAK